MAGRIVISAEEIWTRNNTTNYVLIGEDYPAEGPAMGQPITTLVINSALALAWSPSGIARRLDLRFPDGAEEV